MSLYVSGSYQCVGNVYRSMSRENIAPTISPISSHLIFSLIARPPEGFIDRRRKTGQLKFSFLPAKLQMDLKQLSYII